MIEPGAVLLDRYEVAALIAAGGMGDVFLARDRRLDRDVAIKSFRAGAADPRRFRAEIRTLARLDHPHLVSVFDAGEHDGVPFMVLQHVAGATLADLLRSGPLPPDRVRQMAIEVTSALAYVHEQRVIHRDVKPSNILFDTDGRALLGDFGVAVALDATRLTLDAGTIGTAAYLAPEQASGSDVSATADIYAFGLVLSEALVGRPVYSGTLAEILTAKLASDPAMPANVPAPFSSLLPRMTRRDPSARPSASGVLAALRGEAPTSLLATTVLATTRTRTWWRRPVVAATVAAAIGVLVLGLLALASAGNGSTPSTTTQAPTTAPKTTTTTRPTTTTLSRAELCADYETQLRELEQQKKVAERQARRSDDDDDGDDDRDQVKRLFEERKEDIEDDAKAAGC
jgi:serine/threonine protein kinase